MDNTLAFGRIFEPYNRKYRPDIYLAGGAFQPDAEVDDTIRSETTSIMLTFSHELIHYYQYINGLDKKIRTLEWQATYYGNRLLRHFDSLGYNDEEE